MKKQSVPIEILEEYVGSLSAEQARRSMFSDEYQRMDVLQPTPAALYALEQLMGSDVQPRKEFIFNHIDFSEIKE